MNRKNNKKLLVLCVTLALLSAQPVSSKVDSHIHDEQTHEADTAVKKIEALDNDIQEQHNEDGDHDDHDEHKKQNEGMEHKDHDEHENEQGDDHGHDEHEEAGFVKLTPEQQQMAGIKVETLTAKSNINQTISAPGEVVNDLYNTTVLSIQVNSKVLSRQVVLGQHVNRGDVIAILYSVDIATAQNRLKVSTAEWNRVRKLGKQTVGEKRYIAAKAEFEKDKSLLLAYGFNEKLIEQFLSGENKYQAGQYPVLAPHDGVILQDNFQSGQYLTAGSQIALIVNEDTVWIEALVAPEIGQKIPVGTRARVVIDNKTFTAHVIHDSHAIDEVTRTRKIRLSLKNKEHLLHPGLFADVLLEMPIKDNVMLLPEAALIRSADGDWTVFVEQLPGAFKQQEVELENTINGLHRIKGLESGQRVVVEGAFFLISEMAKAGFDTHNH